MARVTVPGLAPRLTWRALLRLAALGDAIVLGAAFIILRDPEPLAMAAVALLGLGLLRVRGGLAGVILLGLLFANVTLWMLAGTVSILVTRQGWLALVFPAALTAISLVGLVAAVVVGLRRSAPDTGGRAPSVLGLAAVASVVLLLVVGLVRGQREAPTHANEIRLETASMTFSNQALAADGGEVTVRMTNKDLFWHTFTIDELGVDLRVPVNSEQMVTFTAPPGTYEFYCAVPGHDTMLSMRGTLTVP